MMNKDTKIRDTSIMFLLFICCLLLLWGIFGSTYDWFTGGKLVVLLALGSMFGCLVGQEDNPIAQYLVYSSAAGALVVGMHLLPPYFWAARAVGMPYLVAYVITAMLAWGYIYRGMRHSKPVGRAYHIFMFLPLIIFISSLFAVNLAGGTLYASTFLTLFYLVLAISLLIEGIREFKRSKFNGGFLLLGSVLFSLHITFLFKAPAMEYVYLGMGVLFALNMFFTKMKRRSQNK